MPLSLHLRFIFLQVMAPLGAGSAIYLILRTGYFELPVKSKLIPFYSSFIYSIPDGLWLYALFNTLWMVWGYCPTFGLKTWVGFSLFGAITTEILQLLNIIYGTYDPIDIGAYLIAFFIFKVSNNISLINK